MVSTLRILLVDADADRRELVQIVLDATLEGFRVDVVGDPVRLGEALGGPQPAGIVAAHPSPWLPGFELVERLKRAFVDSPIVLLADAATEEAASASLRFGLADFVVDGGAAPIRIRDALRRTVKARPERSADRRAVRRTPPRVVTLPEPEPLAATTPGRPTPLAHRASSEDAPTTTMRALDRRASVPAAPSAEAPTELRLPGIPELLEDAGLGWFRADLDGQLLDCNQALLDLLSVPDREDPRVARLGLPRSAWKRFIKQIRSHGSTTEQRLELPIPDDSPRFVTLTVRGSSAGRSQPVIDGLVIDGTETEKLWERLGDLRLGQLPPDAEVIELEGRRKPGSAPVDRDRLLGLTHDLQEPLRTVRIYADLIEEQHANSLPDDARDLLRKSREAASRMEDMVSGLVDEATLDMRGEPHEADCEQVFDGILANLAAAIDTSGAEVTRDTLPVVALPPSQMAQLLQNLVGNSIKYRGSDAPRIHVSADRGNGEWLFTVRDNGMGIPEEFQPRVFEMFERGADAESLPGSGIGLAVCRRVVESHGGRIWFESTPGEGSTFQFTVPASAERGAG